MSLIDLNVPTIMTIPNVVQSPAAFNCMLAPLPVVGSAGVD